MPVIRYQFCDGTVTEAEVSEELYFQHLLLEKKDALTKRKETRRHQSLDKSLERGFDFPDDRVNVEEEAAFKEAAERLHKAMSKLLPGQRELIRRVYFNEEKMSNIAREEGVDAGSIRHRLRRAVSMLKKLLE